MSVDKQKYKTLKNANFIVYFIFYIVSFNFQSMKTNLINDQISQQDVIFSTLLGSESRTTFLRL